mmetsp:Transcript_20665/g.44774  ORF Transcript_20665/g.44774 Transcript_20665/m.44774 type:complete len:251 (-) Transcript_20665:123-875(-)
MIMMLLILCMFRCSAVDHTPHHRLQSEPTFKLLHAPCGLGTTLQVRRLRDLSHPQPVRHREPLHTQPRLLVADGHQVGHMGDHRGRSADQCATSTLILVSRGRCLLGEARSDVWWERSDTGCLGGKGRRVGRPVDHVPKKRERWRNHPPTLSATPCVELAPPVAQAASGLARRVSHRARGTLGRAPLPSGRVLSAAHSWRRPPSSHRQRVCPPTVPLGEAGHTSLPLSSKHCRRTVHRRPPTHPDRRVSG